MEFDTSTAQLVSLILRSAAHCFCLDISELKKGIVYCKKEFVERKRNSADKTEVQIYLGLRDVTKAEEARKYLIESVRVPKERIAMYARNKFMGTDDIALIKTRESVFFIPGKIMTVCKPS